VKKKQKTRYRIRNWRQYNAALVQRGSLTLWVDEAALAGWRNQEKSGRRGASRTYCDSAIVCGLTLQSVYHLPLRATVGMLRSLFELMQVELPVPDFSTLCRRRQTLEVSLLAQPPKGRLHLLVDASGFKVYGEGEWKVRQHGYSKRRTWRKLHIGIDEATGEVVAAMASTNDLRDDALLGDLLSQVPGEIEQVSGDGIYDTTECYRLLEKRKARAVIPPRRGARKSPKPEMEARNAHIERIQQLNQQGEDGRKKWKQEVGYHRRSLVETAFFRLKTIFGNTLSARHFQAQANELFVRCAALNRMTQLGMPHSQPI
jgi:IS5 family transposase